MCRPAGRRAAGTRARRGDRDAIRRVERRPAGLHRPRRPGRHPARQLQVNLSESLMTVPGVSAESRQNYAQDCSCRCAASARVELRRTGRAPVLRRIPGTMPDGRAVLAIRSRIGRSNRGAARPVLGAVRQFLGRGDRHLHAGRALGLGGRHRRVRNVQHAALRRQDHGQ